MSLLTRAISKITGRPEKFHASLDDPNIHGRYIGIHPLLASRGAGFHESLMYFSLDADGFKIEEKVQINGEILTFTQDFSPKIDWIFRLRNWGVDHCLSIRQHKKSDLAQLIFDFSKKQIPKHDIDVVMNLGEGMFVALGLFMQEKNHSNILSHLNVLHSELYEPAEEESEERSCLIEIDYDIAKAALEAGSNEIKIETLKILHCNLCTASEYIIKARLEFIKIGLSDPCPAVQIEALNSFVLGGRVTDGVAILKDFTNKLDPPLPLVVIIEHVDAICCLLHESHFFNKEITTLLDAFGTSDIKEISKINDGLVSPEQMEAIEKTANIPNQRRWTRSHHNDLRQMLYFIADKFGMEEHHKIKQECLIYLAEFPALNEKVPE